MPKHVWRGRGRLPNSIHSYKDRRILEFLARITITHKVDSNEFFNRIIEAWNGTEAKCENIEISCRAKNKDSAIFLFTKEEKVVAQFPISNSILQGKNQIENYVKKIPARKSRLMNDFEGDPQIKDLKVGMKKITITAKVVEIPKSKMVYTRFGNIAYVSNALISDETGSIRISLWNQQINNIAEGDEIKIINCKVTKFMGEHQLRVGRRGSLNVVK